MMSYNDIRKVMPHDGSEICMMLAILYYKVYSKLPEFSGLFSESVMLPDCSFSPNTPKQLVQQ